jgi:hypothetical protein
MDLEADKTAVTLAEIRWRVACALDRHPLCRNVQFDVVSLPRSRKANWTVTLQSVAPEALWEASDIVADIQDAYELAVAACLSAFSPRTAPLERAKPLPGHC